MIESTASSQPAKAAGTARTRTSVKPIRQMRAETAFNLACVFFALSTALAQRVFARGTGRASGHIIPVAAANAAPLRATKLLVSAATDIMSGGATAQTWKAMDEAVNTLGLGITGYMCMWDDKDFDEIGPDLLDQFYEAQDAELRYAEYSRTRKLR